MKLYKWFPPMYGMCAYFVAAESKEEAEAAIKAHVEKEHDWVGEDGFPGKFDGPYIYEPGQVASMEFD